MSKNICGEYMRFSAFSCSYSCFYSVAANIIDFKSSIIFALVYTNTSFGPVTFNRDDKGNMNLFILFTDSRYDLSFVG